MPRLVWPAILFLVPLIAMAGTPAQRVRTACHDGQSLRNLARAFQFVDVIQVSSRPSCQDVQPPEALATPDPLFAPAARGEKITVSFIIGTDGRVHSPLILQSVGLAGDRRVLQTVRTWK